MVNFDEKAGDILKALCFDMGFIPAEVDGQLRLVHLDCNNCLRSHTANHPRAVKDCFMSKWWGLDECLNNFVPVSMERYWLKEFAGNIISLAGVRK